MQPGPPLPDPYLTGTPRSAVSRQALSGWAVASVAGGIAGVTCVPAFGAVFALVAGMTALGEIARGDRRGRGLAVVGLSLGTVGLVAAMALFVYALDRASAPRTAASTPGPTAAPLRAPRLPPGPPPTLRPPRGTTPAPAGASRDDGVVEATLGKVKLVDVGAGANLQEQIASQRDAARAERRRVLLWLVAPRCKPCDGVAASLTAPSMQEALGSVRLVRVDVFDHGAELEKLGIPTDTIPGFALLDEGGTRAVDYVHGGEWGADIAPNIAPVLGAFVRGAYTQRRHPWQRPRRPDETSL